MAAESNVGARLFLIGKDATLSGLAQIRSAVAALNAEIAAGAKSSDVAAAASDEQAAALARLNAVCDLYRTNLAQVNAEQDAVMTLGKTSFLALSAAAAVWGYESIKWAQNYQTQLVRLRTQAGLTVQAMNAIGRAAMANAAALGTTPTAYLEAAYHPASTGMSTRETIAITNAGAKLAAIGGSPLEDTTNALTGVMKSYNLGASQTMRTAATLNAVVGAGNMRWSDLNAALASGVAASGKTFGVSLPALGGALAFMTDRGVPASQAGTHLRMTLALLGAPSQEADKLLTAAGLGSSTASSATSSMASTLQAAGLSTTQLSAALRNNSGAGGIYNALALLKQALTAGGLSPEMQAAMISRSFGGGRMGTTVEMMYNSLGGLAQKTQQIDRNGSVTKLMKDWNAETQTFDFQLKRLGGTVETLGTSFGKYLLPVLTEGAKLLSDTLGFLDHNKEVAVALAGVVTAILAPAIGLYLYRSFLSTGGAIQSVIKGYGDLLTGQNAEDIALARTEAQLNAVAASTDQVAAANTALGNTAEGVAGKEALAGAGMGGVGGARGILGTAMRAGMYAYGGYLAGSIIRGKNGSVVTNRQSTRQALQTFGSDVAEGAGFGATVGSIVPGVGTGVGAAVGAAGGAVYALHTQIGHVAEHAWDDLFGGGSSSPSRRKLVIQNHVTVEIDGKAITKAVTRQTKRTAALSS